jgi:hypothetical protein
MHTWHQVANMWCRNYRLEHPLVCMLMVVITTYTMCMICCMHATWRDVAPKVKKKSSTRKLLQKRKRKGTLNCIIYAIGVYYSHSRRYFFFCICRPKPLTSFLFHHQCCCSCYYAGAVMQSWVCQQSPPQLRWTPPPPDQTKRLLLTSCSEYQLINNSASKFSSKLRNSIQ